MSSPSGRSRGRPRYPGLLTPAEQRVLEGLKRGLTYQAIADEQGVTYDAVKYHVSNMLSKVAVDSREELVAWAAEGRPLGLPSLSILARVAAGVAALAAAGGAIAVIATMGNEETAEDVLSAASEAMADESFRVFDEDCPLCPPPTVMEFAPPDRMNLSNSKGRDAWPYALLLGDEAYVSSTGQRWRSGAEAFEFLGMALGDPRVLVTVLQSAELGADEDIGGRQAAVVEGELNYDAFFDRLHESFHKQGARDSLRGLLEGTRVRLWINRDDHRVLQMQLIYPDPEAQTEVVTIEYGPVDIPMAVESMDGEEVDRIRYDVEREGAPLLLAIEKYKSLTGAYPPVVDAATLAGVVPADDWPTNPFSAEPMRQSPGTPGDFDYRLIENGAHFQFTLNGWDAPLLYYDSARFGPVPPEVVRPIKP